MKLHYGCGLCETPGWYNCDGSPTLWLQRLPVLGAGFRKWLAPRFPLGVHYGDIVSGLQIPPNTCEAVYCCHVLEHLAVDDLRKALRNTFTYLKPEGIFRAILPDFEQ